MLSHPHRKNWVHVFTLDPVLGADIQERISSDPRLRGYKVIRPRKRGIDAGVAEIEGAAKYSVLARLLILDVRSHTLPRLQHAYNKIVGYNRHDLNELCYTVLIGDGPWSLFHAGKTLDVFSPHLASHRIDYRPAVFFYDPFLHYTEEDRQDRRLDKTDRVPDAVPKRLAGAFKEPDLTMEGVRRFFRAFATAPKTREKVKSERQMILVKLFEKRIAREFPHHKGELKAWLSKEGYALPDETLRLHLYPLFFEDWVFDLLKQTE